MKKSKLLSISLACLLGLGTVSTAVSVFSSVENTTEASAATSSTATLKVSSMSGKTSYDDGHGNFTWTSAPAGTTSNPWSGYYWSLANNQTITFTWTRPAGMQVTDVYTFNNILRSTIAKTGTALSRRMVTTCGIYSLDRAGETAAGRNPLLIKSNTQETRTPQMANVTFSITNTSGQTGYFIAKNEDTSPLKIEYETITSTVTFDKQSGSGGSSSVSVEYNKSMPDITVPTRTGYNFLGYYDAKTGGTQYYTIAGKSAKNWDKDSKSATLYAHWEAAEQIVNVTAGTGVSQVYLSTSSTATSGSASGSKFNSGVTVYAFAKLKKGYNHQSSWAKVSGTDDTEGAIYRVASQQVGTSTVNFGTINASLATYTINYNLNGGSVSGTNPTSYNVNSSAITLINPTKTGYSFTGWSGSGISGKSTSVTIPTGSAGARTYTANFEANKYQVTFDATDGQGGIDNLEVTYDASLPNLTSDQIPSLAPYEGHSYSFGGYFTEQPTPNGDGSYTPHGTQYYDKDGNGVQVWKEANNTTILYAYYTIDMEVTSNGYSGTWNGSSYGISVSVNYPEGTTVYYGNSASTCNDTNANNFLKSDAGSYEIFYEVRKEGFTTYKGSETIVINKADSIVDPKPTAKSGLVYTGEAQELISAGEVDYGSMLYAVNVTGELPSNSSFSTFIPKGKFVGKYYVFYKSSGDGNHNQYAKSLDNVVEVSISRVDRSELSDLIAEVNDYLDSINDNDDYASIVSTLEGIKQEVAQDAIIEDNITEQGVNDNIAKLQAALSAAKVAVTEKLIESIGEISYPDSKNAIDAAKDYFDNVLNQSEKDTVNSVLKNTLDKDHNDYYEAKEVADAIEGILSPSKDDGYADSVQSAKEKYEALASSNPDALALINDATNKDYEKTLNDNVEAEEVIEKIKDIGELTYNAGEGDSLTDIIEAEEVYASLCESNPDAANLVNQVNHEDLLNARESYDDVEKTVGLINSIGDVNHGGTNDSRKALEDARSAYDELSEEEKALVTGYNNSYKTLDDNEHVYEAMVLIDKIGEVGYSNESEEDIKAARAFIDSLSEDQKTLLGDKHLKVLKEAEESFTSLKKKGNTLVISLLVLDIIALIIGSILMYKLLKKRVKKETKVMSISILPLIFASYYVSGPFIVLYILVALTVLVWISNLCLALLKKKQKWIYNPNRVKVIAKEDGEEVKTISDAEGNRFQIRYVKSFNAKLAQASKEEKAYYSELRNLILSYKDISSRVSWHYESFNLGRKQLIKIGVRRNTLCVYLALDVESVPQKYKVEKIESAKYEEVACMYRVKSEKRCELAKQLIERVMSKNQVSQGEEHKEKYSLQYEDRDALVNKGLIKEVKIKLN